MDIINVTPKRNDVKDSIVMVYENTPFTITQEDVILFNSIEEQNDYFEKKLKILYTNNTHAYVRDTNYINVTGNKNKFKKATYLRIYNGDYWIYAFIIDTIYVNQNTTTLIFEFDYFNTYQQLIDFSKISGVVEQSHLKRIENNENKIVLNSQGFDVGEKQIAETLELIFDFKWLVIVAKPSIKLNNRIKNYGTIAGTYKSFNYYIIPVDNYSNRTIRTIYKNDIIESTSVSTLLKTMTNSFSDETNTVNQIVNVYTTKDIGIKYDYNHDTRTITINDNFNLIGLENATSDTLPIYNGDDENNNDTSYKTNCPKHPTGSEQITYTSEYGFRENPFGTGGTEWHNGLDIAPNVSGKNIPIYAVQDSIVEFAGNIDNGFGNYVILKHTNGDTNKTIYAHLDSYKVIKGQKVSQNQEIGKMGTTGRSTGVHLHFEVHETDGNIVYGKDGTSINPKPYLLECREIEDTETNSNWSGDLQLTSYLSGSAKTVTISENQIKEIITACKKYNILPSGVICQLWLESHWGHSDVARSNNNWSGITWTGGTGNKLDEEVTRLNGRYKGTARPSDEGGHYTAYKTLKYFFMDYMFLLGETGYKVVGKDNLEDYTRGLFTVGGARYNYAASGYEHYIELMRTINTMIVGRNPHYKNINKEIFEGAGI